MTKLKMKCNFFFANIYVTKVSQTIEQFFWLGWYDPMNAVLHWWWWWLWKWFKTQVKKNIWLIYDFTMHIKLHTHLSLYICRTSWFFKKTTRIFFFSQCTALTTDQRSKQKEQPTGNFQVQAFQKILKRISTIQPFQKRTERPKRTN